MAGYENLPDEELIVLMKADNEKAFAVLYERYWQKLFYAAGTRLDAAEEAEEVVQDIFISLWQRRHGLALQNKLSTYLAAAVKYRVINVLDKQFRARKRQDVYPAITDQFQDSPSSEDSMLQKELLARIQLTVNRLPEKCRIVFRLSREEGLSNKQIAKELDITESTVEKHITKALKDIRSDLAVLLPILITLLAGRK